MSSMDEEFYLFCLLFKRPPFRINLGWPTFSSNLFTSINEDSILLIGPFVIDLYSIVNYEVDGLKVEFLFNESF